MIKRTMRTGLALLTVFTILSAYACLSQKNFIRFAGTNQEVLLIANQSGTRTPITISLTVRIKATVFQEQKPDTIILLWIARNPDGRYYRAQEEFSVSPADLENDQYFYRNYIADTLGTYTYNVILFPNSSTLRLNSNKASIRIQQNQAN
ncbi:hypothetical protein JXQ70_01055 [bacterium]|nr:hypothetical protein [bacterium]